MLGIRGPGVPQKPGDVGSFSDLGTPKIYRYRSLAKKGPWAVQHYFVLRQGGGRIFVTSLHYTTKKRPCLHYHSLQQDIAYQHTRPVQA